jgi:hypothetical protein
VNLAFYRDGDFFGELSILNGSPRAASVEAYSDCDLLALDPEAVRRLKQSYPEFGKLLDERLAQYKAKTEARIPLDFTPRNASGRNAGAQQSRARWEIRGQAEEGAARIRLPTTRDISGKRSNASANRAHPQIDEMDCGAASLGMICRHFGRKVSLADSPALSHRDGWHEFESALSRGHGTRAGGARAEGFAAQSSAHAACRRLCTGKAITGWCSTTSTSNCRVADPALGFTQNSAERNLSKSGRATPRCLITRPPSNRLRKQTHAGLGLPFLAKFRKILLQVLGLAVAVSFLQLLFPGFHPNGGGQGDRRE